MSESMVERVAKQMHLKRPNSRYTKWEDCSDEYRTGTLRDAYTAIAAMREPTEAMADAGNGTFRPPDYASAEECYQAMIDSALAEKPKHHRGWLDDGPYGVGIERLAANLWRRENPDMSVFACDAAMQEQYRRRILDLNPVKETK